MKTRCFFAFLFLLFASNGASAQDLLSGFEDFAIKGDHVKIDEEAGTIETEGNVLLVYKKELKIFTDRIRLTKRVGDQILLLGEGENRICFKNIWIQSLTFNYFADAKKIVVRGEVKAKNSQLIVLADVFEIDLNDYSFTAKAYESRVVSLKYLPLTKDTRTGENDYDEKCRLKKKLDEVQPRFLLSSKSISWKPQVRTLLTEGKLKLDEEITKSTISADRIRVIFSNSLLPTKIRAYGNFVLRQSSKEFFSDRAEIDLINRIAVLSDNVAITEKDKLFNLQTDLVTIELGKDKPLSVDSDKKIDLEADAGSTL